MATLSSGSVKFLCQERGKFKSGFVSSFDTVAF